MKTNKKRIAVSILTVFMMVFSVIPYMGAKADVAYAAEATKGQWVTEAVSDVNGGLAWSQTFEADDTNFMKLDAGRKYSNGSTGSDFTIKVVDSAANVIAEAESSGGVISALEISQFPKADTYTVELYSQQTKIGDSTYYINYDLGVIHVYTDKYLGEISVYKDPSDEFKYVAVDADVSYDGDVAAADKTVYRENLKTGTFTKLTATDSNKWTFYDYNFKRGTSYKYYLLNNNMLSDAVKAEMPANKTTEKTISAAAKAELATWSISTSYTVEGYTVPATSNLKVTKKYIKGVYFEWFWSVPAGKYTYNLTGFICETFNAKGKKVATKYYKDGRYSTNTIYVPYEGTSTIKVTPYYKDADGAVYYGKAQTVSTTSAKLTTAGAVTKLSTSKARVIAYKTTGAVGTQIQYKLPGKSWKKLTSGTTKKTYKTTLSKKNAGKATYRYRTYLKDTNLYGKTQTYYSDWKTYKPKKNEFKYTTRSWQYYRNQDWNNIRVPFRTHWAPSKVYYSGGKIKLTSKFYNTSGYVSRTCKVKVTFYDDNGKKLATKTISQKVKPSATKTKTITLSTKKNVNLRNVSYKFSYKNR